MQWSFCAKQWKTTLTQGASMTHSAIRNRQSSWPAGVQSLLRKRILQAERGKLPEIAVGGVLRANAMLKIE